MAQEYITFEPQNEYGSVRLNKTVFSSIAVEEENVQLVEGNRPFKGGVTTVIEENHLRLTIPVKVHYKANVTDVCAKLQNKIFESISYMTEFKPDSIEIQVVGFIF